LVDIIDKVADRADLLIKLLQATMESYQKSVERDIRHSKTMSLMAEANHGGVSGAPPSAQADLGKAQYGSPGKRRA
jgi:hypothetical protein